MGHPAFLIGLSGPHLDVSGEISLAVLRPLLFSGCLLKSAVETPLRLLLVSGFLLRCVVIM